MLSTPMAVLWYVPTLPSLTSADAVIKMDVVKESLM